MSRLSRYILFVVLYFGTTAVMTIDYNIARMTRAAIGDAAATSVYEDLVGSAGMRTFADGATTMSRHPWLWSLGFGVAIGLLWFGTDLWREQKRKRVKASPITVTIACDSSQLEDALRRVAKAFES